MRALVFNRYLLPGLCWPDTSSIAILNFSKLTTLPNIPGCTHRVNVLIASCE
jgi:hypothetical protein